MGRKPSDRDLEKTLSDLRERNGGPDRSERPRSVENDDGTITLYPTNGPERTYDPEDFRKGNYEHTDLWAPLSRRACEHIASIEGGDPEEIHQDSIENAIDRLRNPEEYPDPYVPASGPIGSELSETELDALDAVTGGYDPDDGDGGERR